MEEKVYLTSDQYVVKKLEEKEEELDDLLKKFLVMQAENRKLRRLKELIKVEKSDVTDNEIICVYDLKGNYKDILYHSFDDDFEEMKKILE